VRPLAMEMPQTRPGQMLIMLQTSRQHMENETCGPHKIEEFSVLCLYFIFLLFCYFYFLLNFRVLFFSVMII